MLSNYRLSTINKAGSNANGMTLVLVDGGKYKDMIAARMRKPNGRGSWMVYKDCDLDYAEQVTAEHKVTERVNGKVDPSTCKAKSRRSQKSRSLRRHRRKIGSGKMKAGYKTGGQNGKHADEAGGNAGAGK